MKNKTTYNLQLLTAIGLILFWIAFFTIGFENPKYPAYYTKFEHSFPLPDTFLCIILLLAFLNRKNILWKNYTLIAAGAMLFLGLCDFSFNIQNGMYSVGFIDGLMNVFINSWCIGFGIWQINLIFKIQ
jgi:hypothetical protein